MCHVLAAFISLLATAPPGSNPHLAQAKQLLESYQEDQALKVLEQAIRWAHNSPHDLAEAHLLTGLAWAAKANEQNAIESFRQARILEPALKLAGDHSPRVRLWFDRAAAADALTPRELPTSTTTPVLERPIDAPSLAQEVKVPSGSGRTAILRWGGTAGAVLGAASLVAGVTQGLQAAAHQKRSLQQTEVTLAYSEHQQAVTSATRANILYAIGGGLAIAATAAIVLSF